MPSNARLNLYASQLSHEATYEVSLTYSSARTLVYKDAVVVETSSEAPWPTTRRDPKPWIMKHFVVLGSGESPSLNVGLCGSWACWLSLGVLGGHARAVSPPAWLSDSRAASDRRLDAYGI